MATRVTEGARRGGEKIILHGKVVFYGVEVKVYLRFQAEVGLLTFFHFNLISQPREMSRCRLSKFGFLARSLYVSSRVGVIGAS